MAVSDPPDPPELAFVLNWNRAINAGLVGAAAMTVLMLIGRFLGLSALNLELLLGSMVTSTIGPGAWFLGLCMHLVVGAVFGVIYGAVMESLGKSGWAVGLGIACVHAVLAGVILSLLGSTHPLVQAGTLPAPGLFASDLGGPSALLFILLHLMYGAMVGNAYVVLARTVPPPAPHAPGGPGKRSTTVLRRN